MSDFAARLLAGVVESVIYTPACSRSHRLKSSVK